MALVLKSDVSINGAALGDKHGIIGAVDWRYMLDFANGDFLKQTSGSKSSLDSDGITFSRGSDASYVDKIDRQTKIAVINEKRIHYSDKLKRNGLLVETKKINHFINSDQPKTQTIKFLPSTLWVMIWVEGAGSVTVYGAGVSDITGAGTQEEPLFFKSTGSISRDVVVTVNGSLDFVQAEYVTSTSSIGSKIHTKNSLVERQQETALVSSTLLADVFNSEYGSFLIVLDRYSIARSTTAVGSTNPVFEIKDSASNNSVSAARVLTTPFDQKSNQELRIRRFFAGQEQPLSFIANNDKRESIAVSWGGGVLTIAQNGRIVSATTPIGFTPDVLELGSSTSWTGGERRLDGIINKVALYARKLSTAEMVAITKN